MEGFIQYVRGTVVVHNFLHHEEEDDNWIDLSDLQEGEDDLDPEPTTTPNSAPNYERRNEIYYYLSELQQTTIN